jgi:hypothetical protein
MFKRARLLSQIVFTVCCLHNQTHRIHSFVPLFRNKIMTFALRLLLILVSGCFYALVFSKGNYAISENRDFWSGSINESH